MSQDILIRGSRLARCNGAYAELSPYVEQVYAKQWLAYDKTCVIRTIVDEGTNTRYWIIGAADYDTINNLPSTVASEVYFRAPVLIDPLDVTERLPWDPGIEWEDLTGLTPVSNVTLSVFDANNVVVETDAPVTNSDGSTTTTTTYTDIMSGDIWREVSVVRSKIMPVLNTENRYISQKPVLDRVYRFQFVRDFKKIGYLPPWEVTDGDIGRTVDIGTERITLSSTNIDTYRGAIAHDVDYSPSGGVYRVSRVLTYSDMLLQGVDLFHNLYERCGVSRDTYNEDMALFEKSSFYLLICPVDTTVQIYVPDAFFAAQPDESVNEYSKLMLTIDLGPHSDPDMLTDVVSTLSALMEKRWGVVGGTDEIVKIAVYGSAWLTDDDYALLNATRKIIMRDSNVDLGELFCAVESNNLYKELLALQNKLAAYEEIIKQRTNQ